MNQYVLTFDKIHKSDLMAVGGKGVNLGEISRIDGIRVPDGFCVTTEAYRKTIENNAELEVLIEKLIKLKSEDREQIFRNKQEYSRSIIEKLEIDRNIYNEITGYYQYTVLMMPMLYVQVPLQKIYHMHLLLDSRTII